MRTIQVPDGKENEHPEQVPSYSAMNGALSGSGGSVFGLDGVGMLPSSMHSQHEAGVGMPWVQSLPIRTLLRGEGRDGSAQCPARSGHERCA